MGHNVGVNFGAGMGMGMNMGFNMQLGNIMGSQPGSTAAHAQTQAAQQQIVVGQPVPSPGQPATTPGGTGYWPQRQNSVPEPDLNFFGRPAMDNLNGGELDSPLGRRSRISSKYMLDGNENPLENDASDGMVSDKIQNNFTVFA